jgi:hypothetical protein
MISTDLKVLVAIAWENRHGQKPMTATHGEFAAVKRLVKRGLLVEISSVQVGLTNDGERMLRQLDAVLEQGPALRRVK